MFVTEDHLILAAEIIQSLVLVAALVLFQIWSLSGADFLKSETVALVKAKKGKRMTLHILRRGCKIAELRNSLAYTALVCTTLTSNSLSTLCNNSRN